VSAFERVGGNAIDTPTQARERLGSHGGAAGLKPGTTMGRISELEKGVEALRGDIGRLRADYRELEKRVTQLENEVPEECAP
jgi:formate-dependent nitrite reductase cytochrome c552 subunit